MSRRLLTAILGCIIIAASFAGCKQTPPETPPTTLPPAQTPISPSAIAPTPIKPPLEDSGQTAQILGKIKLSTTTSIDDSGLLAYILPKFTAETGWETEVAASSDGDALQMGRDGEADVLLLHSRQDEDLFVEDGYGIKRYDVMHNDYIVVGPKSDLLASNNDVAKTFKTISDNGLGFVSRGDDSGTHKQELSIWSNLKINPESNALYLSIGQSTGIALRMTKELNIYTFSDRATWLNLKDKGSLMIICEGDPVLYNPYSVIPVSASANEHINTEGGQAFVDWITGPSGQELIGKYGVEEFGQPLFIPGA
jgi:tungstate transport system substrate-binding protein